MKREARSGTARRLPAVMLVAWAACSAYLAFAVPVGSPPDEYAHLAFIDHLARSWSFPDFRAQPIGTEMHQPPAYYLLCALLRAAHAPVALLRLLSTLLGLVTILCTHRLARALRPAAGEWFAWACAAVVAFLPMNLYLCSAVSNDPMAGAVVALGLLHLARSFKAERGVPAGALMGLLAGLALLTKSTTVALAAAAFVAYALPCLSAGDRRPALARLGAFLSVMLVVWGPWGIRNTLLYGDPLAGRAFAAVAAGVPTEQFGGPSPAYWLHLVIPYSWMSAWGAYGHLSPTVRADFMPDQWYLAFVPLMAAAWFGIARGGRRLLAGAQPALLLGLAAGALVLLAGYLSFNAERFQSQSRYFFCFLPVCAVVLCAGLDEALPAGKGRLLIAVLLVLLLVGVADGVTWRMLVAE